MNHDERDTPNPTEAEIVSLLGTYADALERNQHVPGVGPTNQSTDNRRGPGDSHGPEGETAVDDNVLSDNAMNEEQNLVDLEVRPAKESSSGRGRALVGALALTGAVVAGGFFLANQDDSSQLDVAEVAAEQDQADDSGDTTSDETAADIADPGAQTGNDGAAANSVEGLTDFSTGFGFGPNGVVFTGEEFISLGDGPDGAILARSPNGTDWSTQLVVGLPEGSSPLGLVQTDSGWATVVTVWPDFDEDEPSSFIVEPQSEQLLATSQDLVTWTTTELPTPELDENQTAFVSSIAASGDRVAILLDVNFNGAGEIEILLDNRVIEEADLENYCGTDFSDGAVIGFSCDFAAEEALEFEILEEDLADDLQDGEPAPATTIAPSEPQEELFRIEAGDPGFDEIQEFFASQNSPEMMAPLVISGTIGEEFDLVELPINGYGAGISGTSDGFLVGVSNFLNGEVQSLSSPDGIEWTEAGSFGGASSNGLATSGERVLTLGQNIETVGSEAPGANVWISDDLGNTWTESAIPTELFGAYGMPVGGDAGFAIQLDGTTEPFEDPFAEFDEVAIEVDGFTMLMNLSTNVSSLLGPDGTVIHDSIQPQVLFGDGAENIVRVEGPFGETLIWLDPETGEDLVSISEEDFNAAFEEAFGEDPSTIGDDFVEQPRATEIWFSEDGVSWVLLDREDDVNNEGGFSALVAVGDDEVILRNEVFVEPPQELFAFEQEGRDPTDEEIELLDEFFEGSSEGSVVWRSISIG